MENDADRAVPVQALVGLDDITHWLVLRGLGGDTGHILMGSHSNWHNTACGTMTPNGEIVQARPARKCRKCMAAMPALRRPQPNTSVRGGTPYPASTGSAGGGKCRYV